MKILKIFIIIFIILIVSGSMFFYYYFNEKPKIENANIFVNVAIKISDELAPDKNIKVPYEIKGLSTTYFKVGNSSSISAILEKMPYNSTFIINIIPNDNIIRYYSSSLEFSTSNENNQQIHLFLRKADGVILSSNTSLFQNNNLNLNIKTKNNGNYDNLVLCFKYGLHIIKILPNENYQQIDIPNIYKNYNSCFYTGISFNKLINEANIQIVYKSIGNFDLNDFLIIVALDSNFINGNYQTEYNKNDIGGINEFYEFSY